MKSPRGALALARCCFTFALLFSLRDLSASAQQPCTRRTIAVGVTDKNGEPVPGLTAADFRAEFRGQPVQILSVAPRTRPVRIVVLLDRSGSIGSDKQEWGVNVEAAAHLYSAAPNNSQLALLLFGDAVEQRSGFGDDKATVASMLLKLAHDPKQGKGGTAYYDAVLAALKAIPSPQRGDVIYAVTDGIDTASQSDRRMVEERLLHTGVRFFAFTLTNPFVLDPAPDQLTPISLLSKLTEVTGGALFPLRTPPNRRETEAVKLYKQMTTAYDVEIELPVAVDEGREWKLGLVRAKELKRPQLAYPRKLMPCAVPAAQAATP